MPAFEASDVGSTPTGATTMSARYERELRAMLEAHGYLVVRAAGSLGVADLVASPPGLPSIYIEEKSTQDDAVFYVRGRALRDQYNRARDIARAGHIIIYAVRFKTGPQNADDRRWRFFVVKDEEPMPMRRSEGYRFEEFFTHVAAPKQMTFAEVK